MEDKFFNAKNKHKVAVVTGASGGIGLKIAEHLVRNNYKVYSLSRLEKKHDSIFYISCDITNLNHVKLCLEEIYKKSGRIDVIINNSGFGIGSALEDMKIQDFKSMMDVNVFGAINVINSSIGYLAKTQGRIINIGSMAAPFAIPYQTGYSITKACIYTLTDGFATELLPLNIKITDIMPGDTKTEFTANRKKPYISEKSLYKDITIRAVKKMEKGELKGRDPNGIGKLVVKLLKKKNPPIHIAVGIENKLFMFLRRICSLKFINFVLKNYYG